MRSPERAWARARVQPHILPHTSIPAGVIPFTSTDPFQSRSCLK